MHQTLHLDEPHARILAHAWNTCVCVNPCSCMNICPYMTPGTSMNPCACMGKVHACSNILMTCTASAQQTTTIQQPETSCFCSQNQSQSMQTHWTEKLLANGTTESACKFAAYLQSSSSVALPQGMCALSTAEPLKLCAATSFTLGCF